MNRQQRSDAGGQILGHARAWTVTWGLALSCATTGAALPQSLKTVPSPEPVNLGDFLRSEPGRLNAQGYPTPTAQARAAAVALGKALFWDMQVGSDGQACASCHFHAGADNRTRNQVSPGLNAGDTSFQVAGPNGAVTRANFPFHQRANPDRQDSPVTRDANDVMSSMGVFLSDFAGVPAGNGPAVLGSGGLRDQFVFAADPVFTVGANRNTRRVAGRNSPTVINAVFNYDNFWDGRARNIFNGVNPFGPLDPDARIWVNNGAPGAAPIREVCRIPDASLASQAVGPPLSDMEMSYRNRTFPQLGRKMLQRSLRPLRGQQVAANDSVFGLPNALGLQLAAGDATRGLVPMLNREQTYVALIKMAFQDKYWDGGNVALAEGSFTQMEANFPLFWGLAIQMYEATLRSDETRFDRFLELGPRARLTDSEQRGMVAFFSIAEDYESLARPVGCSGCHSGPLFTSAWTSLIRAGEPQVVQRRVGNLLVPEVIPNIVPAIAPGFLPLGAIELMVLRSGRIGFYDEAYYDIGVRPTAEDVGRGAAAPSGLPLSYSWLAIMKFNGLLDPELTAPFVPTPTQPAAFAHLPVAADGIHKVPGLRNIELQGPYFHNGGAATLRQVVQHYTRGGNFPANTNLSLLGPISSLVGKADMQNDLVAFMLTLTDDRVKFERAPFDHPQLFLPSGNGINQNGTQAEVPITLPAVGRSGRAVPIPTFLSLPPTQP
ncbi:MAG: cytochrome C peroxidase [Verrucomicrobia bacterium]|nr:cytochrome C peroxidase [Verrucomicrobiota bacterium]